MSSGVLGGLWGDPWWCPEYENHQTFSLIYLIWNEWCGQVEALFLFRFLSTCLHGSSQGVVCCTLDLFLYVLSASIWGGNWENWESQTNTTCFCQSGVQTPLSTCEGGFACCRLCSCRLSPFVAVTTLSVSVVLTVFQSQRFQWLCDISAEEWCFTSACLFLSSSHLSTLSPHPPKIDFLCITFCSTRVILRSRDAQEKFESPPLKGYQAASLSRRRVCFLQDNPGSSLAQRHPIPISPKASAIVSSALWWQISGAVRIAG